jgi:DNA-directed RNA polymerase subunit RPC12/RpoP
MRIKCPNCESPNWVLDFACQSKLQTIYLCWNCRRQIYLQLKQIPLIDDSMPVIGEKPDHAD